ncbi:MAG: hypothetical protein KBD53_00615 [Candidatus Omnitrophica bacterium]|nr:hypothetical protein [Candidatus Omnitrophota bacterium]
MKKYFLALIVSIIFTSYLNVHYANGSDSEKNEGEKEFGSQNEQNDDCYVYSKENSHGYQEGESILACLNKITYFYQLFGFKITLSRDWRQKQIGKQSPDDLAKFRTVRFSHKVYNINIYLKMEKSSASTLEEVVKQSIHLLPGGRLNLDSKIEKTKIRGIKAVKYAYSYLEFEEEKSFLSYLIVGRRLQTMRYLILHEGFLYEINLSAWPNNNNEFNKYISSFEEIINTIEFTERIVLRENDE